MAKQTFSVGQVLTAAQMLSLQETAMGGGSATAKTASYTLVAADAGTTIAVNSTSATTITVNTSLFAAGDSVFIQNLGAGTCTITAGTATVNTSASLALAQYEGGQLYFVSASSAIFFKADGAAAASGGMTLLSTTTLSGASTTISAINQTYNNLYILISGINNASNSINKLKPNSSSITDTIFGEIIHNVSAAIDGTLNDAFPISARQTNLAGNTNNAFACEIFNYASTTNYKVSNFCAGLVRATSSANTQVFGTGLIKTNSAITDIEITSGTGNFSGGTVLVYGVK